MFRLTFDRIPKDAHTKATNPTMDNPLTKYTLTTSYQFPVRHGMHADTSMCRTRPTANARVLCAYMGEPPDLIPSSVAILVDLAKERVRIGRESRELVKRCDRPYAELACHFGCYLLRRPWALGARLVLLGGRAFGRARLAGGLSEVSDGSDVSCHVICRDIRSVLTVLDAGVVCARGGRRRRLRVVLRRLILHSRLFGGTRSITR